MAQLHTDGLTNYKSTRKLRGDDAPPRLLQTDRTLSAEIKLYYDVHTPAVIPAPLLIALHGYGASKRQMMREARQIAPPSFAIAALQGFINI